MTIKFRPRRSHQGFDGNTFPPTQVIPAGEVRTVFVLGRDDLVPRFRFPGRVESVFPDTSSRRRRMRLDLKGVRPTTNVVEWVPQKKFQGNVPLSQQLNVHVVPRLTFRTAFNFVIDGPQSGKDSLKTNRKVSEVEAMVAEAKRILQPQTNIVIEATKIRENIQLDHVLGKEIKPKKGPFARDEVDHWKAVTAKGDTTVHLNVFFVWKLNFQNAWHEETLGLSHAGDPNILIEDSNKIVRDPNKAPPGATLAHELLHVLGRAAHSPNSEHLMAESYEPGGIFIPSNATTVAHTFAKIKKLGEFQTSP